MWTWQKVSALFDLAVDEHKFWPSARRVDDALGDWNPICTCPPMSEYADA